MNTAVEQKEPIFEVNKTTLIKAKSWCKELNQNNDKKISINLEFYSYDDVGLHIESLLNAVINADENELKREPIMFQYVASLSSQLVRSLPLEFLDKLLISQSYNKEEFTNIKNL
jgi:hypothetical protein